MASTSVIDGLIQDIQRLRRNRGYSMSKLHDCKHILSLPTVRGAGPTEDDQVNAAHALLFDALDELSDGAEVARAMLGLGPIRGETLTFRLQQLPGSLQTNHDRKDVVTRELAHHLNRLGRAKPRATPLFKPVLRHTRDVRLHLKLEPLNEAGARLQGRILRVNKRYPKKIIFMSIRDTDDEPLQLMARREDFEDEAWERLGEVREGDTVTATGTVGWSERGEPSVILDDVPVVREETLDISIAEGDSNYARIGSQMLCARLRRRASDFFRSEDFLEIEPSLFTASWQGPGLEPLRVHYPGFGTPAYLAPSPAAQLLDAIVITGVERVFAVSRCFSTTYRDEKSSDQSLILVAKAIHLRGDDVKATMQRAIATVLGDLETFPDQADPKLVLTGWEQESKTWPPEPALVRSKPTIEVFENPPPSAIAGESSAVTQVLRGVWPPNRVICEGAVELVDGRLPVASVTLHLERMVSLLRDLPLRQLRLADELVRTHTARGKTDGSRRGVA